MKTQAGQVTHVAVWLTAVMLHEEGKTSVGFMQLVDEVERRFGGDGSTVRTHVNARCCSSAPKSHGTVYNYLVRTSEGEYRVFRPGDEVHPTRLGARTYPRQELVPEEYRGVWQRWAVKAE